MSLSLVTNAARQARALEAVGHRPWPVPGWPWSVAHTLVDAVSCHWPVEPEVLEQQLPAGVEPDTHAGQAWLTVAALRVTGLRVRGLLPVPGLSDGAELVVRVAVLVGGRPASLPLAAVFSSPAAAQAARRLYGLPATRSRIHVTRSGKVVHVESSRSRASGAPAVFHARFEPIAPALPAAPGSLDAFLHERFLLAAGRPAGGLVLAEQHRPPWRLAPARVTVELETVVPPGLVRGAPALAHVAEPLDQLVWAPERQDG